MPKTIEYPTASIKKSLELAKAIDELGGNSSIAMSAEKLGKKISGGFQEIIQGAVKYNFIIRKHGELSVTSLYRDIKLAYNEKEKEGLMQKAFLNVPLFQKICDRFKGQKIPIDIFDKLLIKEFGVSGRMADRVKKYFIEGAKAVNLLSSDNMLYSCNVVEDISSHDNNVPISGLENDDVHPKDTSIGLSPVSYSVKILGPGINSTISIIEEEDLVIVNSMLKKIEKKLKEKE